MHYGRRKIIKTRYYGCREFDEEIHGEDGRGAAGQIDETQGTEYALRSLTVLISTPLASLTNEYTGAT